MDKYLTEQIYTQQVKPLCPVEKYADHNGMSAVNALALAEGISWDEAFEKLMIQVHKLKRMPEEPKCAYEMLEAAGFIRQPGVKEHTVNDFLDYMNGNCTAGQVAIVKTVYGNRFILLAPNEGAPDGSGRYCAYTIAKCANMRVSDVWVRWADGLDHSPVRRRKGSAGSRSRRKTPADTDRFHYLQKNPQCVTGDCVIRALAAVLDISWDEAMDRVLEETGPVSTLVNMPSLYEKYLKKEGFQRRKPPADGGKPMRGSDFCRQMDSLCRDGQRIFAQVGRGHVAAVLPAEENGTTHYNIVDIWDCTDRWIVEYWVSASHPEPAAAEKTEPQRSRMEPAAGRRITHPGFGTGVIRGVYSGWLEAEFEKYGLRMLQCKWVREHCRIQAA